MPSRARTLPIIDDSPRTASRWRAGLRVFLAAATLTTAVAAQFTAPYSGVGRKVRSSALPIVVMKYEPNTPYSHDRYVLFGRQGNRIYQIAKNRSNTWHSRVEVPFVSGLVPADDPVAFHNPDASVVSLFVLGSSGTIYQATAARYDAFDDWSGWSALPNSPAMASTCAAVNTPNGLGVAVFAIGLDGRLYNNFYSRGSGGGWGSWSQVPNSPRLVGRPAVVNGPPGGQVINIFATDTAGVVQHVTFTRGVGSGAGWSGWSTLSGPRFRGSPSCYALGSLVSVFAAGQDGQIYQAVRGSGGWGSWSSLGSPSSGQFMSCAATNSPDESTLEIVGRTDAGVIELKTYTRGGGGWSSWAPTPTAGTLTGGPTIKNWHTRTSTRAETQAKFFGAQQSVGHWFGENSQGRFPVREAYTSNWLTMPDDPNTAIDESSYEFFHGSNYAEKARVMIQNFERLTGNQFSFAQYDTSPRDGIVTTDELMVYWVYPGEGARVRGTQLCIPVSSSLCVQLTYGLPRSAAQIGPATICEELCHGLFGLDDLYETSQLPNYVGPGRLTLISNNAAFPHLHPWGKLKLGWVDPTVVTQDGWHRLRPIEFQQDLLVVHDPGRGPSDYFLVENRWPNGSIEAALPDRGLGVWRIGEHYAGQSNWGRRTIQLLRAGGGRDDTVAFWDGSDPRTSYHLTPGSVPANTRWDDGSNSNIAFYHFPTASDDTYVFVDVPPLRSSPPAPRVAARYDYIDQRAPYQNPNPLWFRVLQLPVLGTNYEVELPASFTQGTTITTFFVVTGFQNPNVVLPVFDGYLYASLDLVRAAPFASPGQRGRMIFPLPDAPALSGFPLYQQVVRVIAGQSGPLGVSRGARLTLGY